MEKILSHSALELGMVITALTILNINGNQGLKNEANEEEIKTHLWVAEVRGTALHSSRILHIIVRVEITLEGWPVVQQSVHTPS